MVAVRGYGSSAYLAVPLGSNRPLDAARALTGHGFI